MRQTDDVRATLGTWPARRARINPHRAAFIEGSRTVSYGELADRVERLAHGLRRSEIRPGDRVAFLGRNSIAMAETMFAVMRVGAIIGSDVALVNAPMFHTATLDQVVLTTFIKGGASVIVAKFDPASTLDLIEKYGVTYMFGVPTMFTGMAQHPRWAAADLSSIRLLTCGGAPVPAALIETYRARGLTFQQGYGLTEASPGVTFMRADREDADPGATGVPSFFVDVRIADPAGGLAAPGGEGEIQARGPNVMAGYWGNPQATADAIIDNGWLRTGDIAYEDEAGFVHVVDRLKDMIISGGENIYPAEVEKALMRHDSVAECAVIGVPDSKWGEVGRALVVRRDGATATAGDILASLDSHLARYKIPRSLLFVDELPHNATGKLVKKRIPDHYRQETP